MSCYLKTFQIIIFSYLYTLFRAEKLKSDFVYQ